MNTLLYLLTEANIDVYRPVLFDRIAYHEKLSQAKMHPFHLSDITHIFLFW